MIPVRYWFRWSRRPWLLALAVLAGWLVRAEPGLPVEYSVRRWTSSEQLPLSTVEAITQTRDGFIWFAMNGGLGRFDGVTLEVFSSQDTPELPVSYITALAEGRDGSLWIGSAGGGLARWREGRFERFGPEQGLANEQIKALAVGRDDRLWIGTDGGGVFLRESTGTFQHFGVADGLTDPFVVGLKLDSAGQVLVLTFKSSVFVLRNGRFEVAPIERPPARPRGLTLTRGTTGRVWLGSSEGVYVWGEGQFRPWEPAAQLGAEQPVMAWETATNEVWLGTSRSLIHWQGGRWATYATGGAAAPRSAGGFLQDHEGSVWISTEGGGLVQLRPTPVVTIGTGEGLAGDEVTSVLALADGGLWVGTTHGLTRLSTAGVKQFRQAEGLPDDCVFSLLEAKDGEIWVSTRQGGVVRWDGRQFHRIEAGSTDRAHVAWCLANGADDTVWAGTSLGARQYRNGQLLRVVDAADGLSNSDVRSIVDDGRGVVWLGTSYGLNRLDAAGMTSVAITPDKEPIEVVVSLHLDAEGTLWIGTLARGLFRLREGRYDRISTADGLPNEGILSIIEDDEGQLWLGTGNGLVRVSKDAIDARIRDRTQPLTLRVFQRADGLRSLEFTGTIQPVSARGVDGRLWFGTADGLVVVRPKLNIRPRKSPMVSLERVAVEGPTAVSELRGQRADRGEVRLTPAKELDHAPAPAARRRAVFAPVGIETLRIPPGQERLDFQFVSPSFIAPHAVNYRHRLDSFDGDWVEVGARRAAYYTRVPPGKYTFRVEARNEAGVWSQAGATLGVIVEPAWWQRTGVRVAGAALFLGSGAVFYLVHTRKLRRQREESAQFSRRLIRSQEHERARIAGELHDGLGQELQLIRNRAELALRRHEPATAVAEQLTSISETAARAIGGVRALSRGLRPPELDQLGLTQALHWLGKNVAESFAGNFDFRIEPVDGALDREQELDLYRVAQEALNNAVKHSSATEITFEVQRVDGMLQMSVFDNGRGFVADEAAADPRVGSGLKNMNERAAMLRGTLELQSVPETGTRLTLRVPVTDNGPAK